jgi:AbrB family looped-hinge helix DNA binding protein
VETTVSTKGQIVIPSSIRRKLGIEDGTRIHIEVHERNMQIVLTSITREFIRSLRGKYKGRGMLKALEEDRKREREL